jgi:adenine deaminase
MNHGENRKTLREVGFGKIAPDSVITNGSLVNVFTKEFIKKQSISRRET